MANFDVPMDLRSAEYQNGSKTLGLIITNVSDGKSGSVLSVGDTVTVTWFRSDGSAGSPFSAEFIGTMSVTVSGQTQVFMVLKDTSFAGRTLHYVVGLKNSDAPATLVETGNSANVTAESFTVCFFPGTLIATPSGERRVEELVPGDLVLVEETDPIPTTWVDRMTWKFPRKLGLVRSAPVKWIGRQTVSTRFGPADRLMPVRFVAGSLGGAIPSAA